MWRGVIMFVLLAGVALLTSSCIAICLMGGCARSADETPVLAGQGNE